MLGLLSEGPLHGYQLSREFHPGRELGDVLRLKMSLLYSHLAKLESDGLISCTLEQQGARPPRKLYSLTEAGHQEYLDWVSRPVRSNRDVRLEFLLKLYFALREGPKQARSLVEAQLEVCERNAASLANGEASPYGERVRRLRELQAGAILEWLREVRAQLEAGSNG